MLLLWTLCTSIGPVTLQYLGLDAEHLSTTAQALVHLGVDIGELLITVGILWQKLKRWRPWKFGWFQTKPWPIQQWLVPVAIAALAFPFFDIIAKQAQVAH